MGFSGNRMVASCVERALAPGGTSSHRQKLVKARTAMGAGTRNPKPDIINPKHVTRNTKQVMQNIFATPANTALHFNMNRIVF